MLYCNNKAIIKKVKIADSFFRKFKGLMFESKEKFDYALIFVLEKESRIRASVHMLFVFFPIGILYLDKNKKVREKAILKPWRLNYTPKKPAKYFIEIPLEYLRKVEINDKIDW
ncbi:MAG: DUF192 domain-containing protein, partial [Candidatus Diapherotrites archaeon]